MYLEIECLSDTCFAQPASAVGPVDTEIAQDDLGLPLPSGKTLHGLLRDTWQIAKPAWSMIDPKGVGESLLGKTQDHSIGAVLRVGDAALSPDVQAWIAWARDGRGRKNNDRKLPAAAVAEAFLAERNLTAEDRTLGTSKTESLRRIRVIPRGTVLISPLTQLGRPFGPEQRQFLETLAALTRHVGLHRNRGLGYVRLFINWEEEAIAPAAAADPTPFLPISGTLFMPFSLTLTAPCLIAHQELDENSIITKTYLPGAALRGVVASALERQGMAAKALGNLIAGGRARFLNAYPVGGDFKKFRALPTPITWRRKKDIIEDDWNADPLDEAVALLMPPPTISDEITEVREQRQPVASNFYAPTSAGRYVSVKPKTRARTHQQRNSATGATSKSGQDNVFVYEALERGQTFHGYIALTDPALWPSIQQVLEQEFLLLGRSGRAGYGGLPQCRMLSPNGAASETLGSQGDIPEDCLFTIRLTADAVLRDPCTGQHDPHALSGALKKIFGVYADVLGTAVATTSAQGYNRLWRTELPTVPAAAMGSVALLKTTLPISANQALQMQSQPLGERTLDGNGCFLIDRIISKEDEDNETSTSSLSLEEPPAPALAPMPKTEAPKSKALEEVRDAQKRLYALCLRRLIAQEALKANEAGNCPPSSLIGRLRVSLRDPLTWKQTWRTWLGESPEALRQEAKTKIFACTFNGVNLKDWMLRTAREDDSWQPALTGEAQERERHQIIPKEMADEIWNAEMREESVRLHYAGSVLAHLARVSAGQEESNP